VSTDDDKSRQKAALIRLLVFACDRADDIGAEETSILIKYAVKKIQTEV